MDDELSFSLNEIENFPKGIYYIVMEVNAVNRAVSRIVKIK